jgi:uracil-DNA glycosylase family 4
MIVGDAPGKTDESSLTPFSGSAGVELTKMLNEAGILRSEVYLTNICKRRPPWNDLENWIYEGKIPPADYIPTDLGWVHPWLAEGIEELEKEIDLIKPNLIIALSDEVLSYLCGRDSIAKWRGSCIKSRLVGDRSYKVLPTYHPATVLKQWSWRWITVHDLRRAAREADYEHLIVRPESYIIRPDFSTAMHWLAQIPLLTDKVSVDIETSRGRIDCISFAWTKEKAICIPFSKREAPHSYWTEEEELTIRLEIRNLLQKVKVIGQNWAYDQQYICKEFGVIARLHMDTMLQHHVHFPGTPKSLDYIASLYCENYTYWKDEGKEVDEHIPEEQRWIYNCKDTTYTLEAAETLETVEKQIALKTTPFGTPPEIQHRLFPYVLEAMLRGVRLDLKARTQLVFTLTEEESKRQTFLNTVLGAPLNPRSPKQLQRLFYEELQLPVIVDRKTRRPTTNADALDSFAKADPILRPICAAINQIRQLSNFRSFCAQPIDSDGRIRCSYNIAGTETFRFASSEDAFGFGTNLQNVSSGDERSAEFPLPNLRKLFIPDEGCEIGDFDAAQADARVVAWEANDEPLMELFNDPSRDLHNENTATIFGHCKGKDDPNRQAAKTGVHLTNYGGTPPVLATALGITRHEAERFQRRWFDAHPAIAEWHRRTLAQITSRRYVENAFGYRRFYFDRIEGILKEALAWIPQSTVAIAVNLGIMQVIDRNRSAGVQFLLQVHDSAVFQWPKNTPGLFDKIRQDMLVSIPYPTPLILPVGGKRSCVSWGDCK